MNAIMVIWVLAMGGMEVSSIRKRRLGDGGLLFGLIIVMGVCRGDMVLILCAGLCFASIALLPEGEVKVIAQDADPILRFVVRVTLCWFL